MQMQMQMRMRMQIRLRTSRRRNNRIFEVDRPSPAVIDLYRPTNISIVITRAGGNAFRGGQVERALGIGEYFNETTKDTDRINGRVQIQKCRFNGIDRLAEILWNRNPCRSKTIPSRVHAFDIPLFQRWLSLRPPYPKSWLWTRDEAALCLQRYVRGWLVRKRVDVQELRQFWKDFAEKDLSNKQLGDRVGQQEATSIEGGTRIADAGKDKPTMHNGGFLRCKAYRRAIAAKGTNHLKPKDSSNV